MATASLSSSNAPEHVVSGNEGRVLELLAEETWASQADHHALCQALVKVGTKGNLKVLRLLLKHGAGVNPRRENELSPLLKAAEAGHLAVTTELLEHGADPNWRGKNGQTALFPACMRGHNRVVKALLDKGADVNGGRNQDDRPGDKDGRTPLLFLAAEKRGRWNMDTIKLLLQQKDVNLDPRDSIGRTPLHWAATNNYIDLARALLSGEAGKQADINASQNRGKTALHLAAEHSQVDFVELLLAHGAHLDAVSDGRWTPLHNACDKGHDVVVAKLLAAGANVNAELSNRMTPLHWAAFNGHGTVVKLLLERPETNMSIKDQFERTALLCAAERHHKDLVHLLSPSRASHRLSESAREASKLFSATVVDFGDFQEMKFRKGDVQEKKKQLVFKPSIYDLLYGWEDSEKNIPTVPILAKNVKWEPHFRWIHLPANNIAWMETLLAKSFVEGGFRDVEGFKALEKCFDQEHVGVHAHAKFMRTFNHRVPSRRAEKDDVVLGSVSEQAAEAAPTLAESIITDTSENSISKPETKKKSKSEQMAERHPGKQQKRKKGNPGNPPGTKEAKLSSRQSSFAPSFASTEAFRRIVNNGKMVLFMPFLHYETHDRRLSMAETIQRARTGAKPQRNASRDELLVHAYVNDLHPRRTLDQFFYHGIDTTQRDNDQVVWRYCREHRIEPKVFMVDQLWLWILGGDTVITCFPQRWDQPPQDPLNVIDGIVEETNAKTRPPIQSVYDLAMVITGRASGLFDRHRLHEQQFQFLDMFESSIGHITDQESRLFSNFLKASEKSTQWLKRYRRGTSGSQHDNLSDDLLNIHQETKLLAEIKDIQDELNIIDVVLSSQVNVLKEFQNNITDELRVEGSRRTTDGVIKEIRRRFQEQERLLEVHQNDLDRMEEQADSIYSSLTNLLDLKQKHSNALEARFAREQAIIAAKQGQTIMIFTIVTIIFLPMSFIAAFFAINFQDWGDHLTIGYVSKYMFGIGLAISFVFVALAFLVHDISDAWKSLAAGSCIGRLSRKTKPPPDEGDQPDDISLWTARENKPGTAGAASTGAYRTQVDDVDWKRGILDGPDNYTTLRMSRDRDRDRDRYDHARFGLSPVRYGGRKLSVGSGQGITQEYDEHLETPAYLCRLSAA
ncbi:ankyrin repeat and protein kinase domain-containing protein 1 [Diaporthe helianthi]|uniref:Ankyrin repeat and protein kinase domain-containing protein 1 n=1 Tax=Diaporthe helianthi TaxID=158607 RepID=A0A2P5HUY1_DIAHE|nr:ankyrin repeat and protein kinase domain-containing protein 1 [Diaporthe helianthi]